MKTKTAVECNLENIDKTIKEKQKELKKLISIREGLQEKSFIFCSVEKHDYECVDKWDDKLSKMVDVKKCGCQKDRLKTDFFYVGMEEYRINNCGHDAGYGDCDTFRWEHTYSIYRVCKHCKKMVYLSRRSLETSESWCRCEWDDQEIKKLDITPKGWNGPKFYKFNTHKACEKFYYQL